METVTTEYLLQLMGTLAIDADLLAEIVLAIGSSTQHGSHSILGTVAGTATEGIEHAGREDQTKGQTLVTLCQIVEMTMEQLVRDTGHTNTFASIAEGLGTRNQQDVIIRIATYRGLIRCLERYAQILAEVHGEVRQVFHDDGVILCSQASDGLQFLLVQTNPRRVVGIRIDNGTDVALREIALQLGSELVATIVVNVEGLVLDAHDLQLHLLNGEAWVDEQHGILLLRCLRTGKERGKRALHGTSDGYATFRSHVETYESLDEAP